MKACKKMYSVDLSHHIILCYLALCMCAYLGTASISRPQRSMLAFSRLTCVRKDGEHSVVPHALHRCGSDGSIARRELSPECYVVVGNIHSGANIGRIVRSASVFGVAECIVVGQV